MVLRPYYPASQLYRMTRDRDGLQLDFMARIDGIRSFESLRARATAVLFGTHTLLVASLTDIIKSKESAGREQDLAVLPFSGAPSVKKKKRKVKPRDALKKESERALVEQIRRQLALPPEKRTHFLRVRFPNGGTAL